MPHVQGRQGRRRLPRAGRERAAVHAGNFLFNRSATIRNESEHLGEEPVILAPFDTELFGHWWYEGPHFLEQLFRQAHAIGADLPFAFTLDDSMSRALSMPADWSPLQFYSKLFGEDFQDPNLPDFKPSARTMVRKSVLTGVLDRTKELDKVVGAEDKARIDQYFSGLRDLERQFDQQLKKPEPRAACVLNKAPKEDGAMGGAAEMVSARHRLMTDLMVMAVACDQTRVFNMAFSNASSNTTKFHSMLVSSFSSRCSSG